MSTRRTLAAEAYADDSGLAARIPIYAHQEPRLDLVAFALERLGTVAGPVLDLGWGTGAYTRRLRDERPHLRVIPMDLTPGMRPEVVGEVDHLPFADGSAGAILAMHMLYYATDQRAALEEARRVLRSGGRLLVSTNGREAGKELRELWTSALHDLGADPSPYPRIDEPFLLDRAADLVRDVFGSANTAEHRSRIVVPRPEPVLAYVASSRREHVGQLPPGVTWDAYLAAADRRVRAEIARSGAFVITGHVGVVTAERVDERGLQPSPSLVR
ncbi:class I SAM-dependent methyltransferase [Jiangella muralis]|uniref:class I SAM-dependent methyltransferase n=1 Tax=Jiangella muralis TaxID=702383 RepID=UPI00069EF8E1|nr:class I SAM-dependent methyltransferase [Jiangella muralis]